MPSAGEAAASASAVGHRSSHARYRGTTRATCVCWSMTSLTRMAYGSRVARHGRSRRTAAYQRSSAPRRASRSAADPPAGNGLRGRLVAHDVRELAPEVADLVAQARGVLEAQVLRGGEHLLL